MLKTQLVTTIVVMVAPILEKERYVTHSVSQLVSQSVSQYLEELNRKIVAH